MHGRKTVIVFLNGIKFSRRLLVVYCRKNITRYQVLIYEEHKRNVKNSVKKVTPRETVMASARRLTKNNKHIFCGVKCANVFEKSRQDFLTRTAIPSFDY